jgi:hypothetical protein
MRLADGVRKRGFRKWYERELLQGHAHLVLTFFCLIGLFAAFEALGKNRDWLDQAVDLLAIAACSLIGLWALRRYLYFLHHAEAAANQADCPACKTYGRFQVDTVDEQQLAMVVQCRKCEHRWTIFD